MRALELLSKVDDVATHLIVTASGQRTIARETDYAPGEVRDLADHHHNVRDIGAAVSSGSFVTAGMLVAPCSVRTLSGIANSYNDELPTTTNCLQRRMGSAGRRRLSQGATQGGAAAA